MLELLLLVGACVYVIGLAAMLGAGIATEMGHRNPEWRFVVFAAVAWPYILAINLYHRY